MKLASKIICFSLVCAISRSAVLAAGPSLNPSIAELVPSQYVSIKTPNDKFRIFYDPNHTTKKVLNQISQLAEKSLTDQCINDPFCPDLPVINIIYYATKEDFISRARIESNGLAFSKVNSFLINGEAKLPLTSIIPHEICHIRVGQITEGSFSQCIEEGYAVLNEPIQLSRKSSSVALKAYVDNQSKKLSFYLANHVPYNPNNYPLFYQQVKFLIERRKSFLSPQMSDSKKDLTARKQVLEFWPSLSRAGPQSEATIYKKYFGAPKEELNNIFEQWLIQKAKEERTSSRSIFDDYVLKIFNSTSLKSSFTIKSVNQQKDSDGHVSSLEIILCDLDDPENCQSIDVSVPNLSRPNSLSQFETNIKKGLSGVTR